MARVWYRAVSVLLIRRVRPIGEPEAVANRAGAFGLVDGTAGAGRISLALAELGVAVADVTQAVVDAHVSPAALDAIDLGRRFETVVLGSHLVNLPNAEARRAFLRLAVRHAAVGGRAGGHADVGKVIVEHHPVDWATTAEPTEATPGSAIGMEDVRRHPPFVSAVSTFDIGGRYVRQPFTARVLLDEELAEELRACGLVVDRRLSPTFLRARPA
jgi:hypothetical protein